MNPKNWGSKLRTWLSSLPNRIGARMIARRNSFAAAAAGAPAPAASAPAQASSHGFPRFVIVILGAIAFLMALVAYKAVRVSSAYVEPAGGQSSPIPTIGTLVLVAALATMGWAIGKSIWNHFHPSVPGNSPRKGWWQLATDGNAALKGVPLATLLIAVALLFINWLCARADFLWWRAGYEHKAFWVIQSAILVACVMLLVSKVKVVRLFAWILIAIFVATWYTAAEPAYAAARRSSSAIAMPEPPPSLKRIVKERVPVPAEEWSEWEPILKHKMTVWPGSANVEYEVRDIDGNVTLRGGTKNGHKDWEEKALEQRYRADRNTVYTLERI